MSSRRVVFVESNNVIHPIDKDCLILLPPFTVMMSPPDTINEDVSAGGGGESGWYTPGEINHMRDDFAQDRATQRWINRQRMKNRWTRALKR